MGDPWLDPPPLCESGSSNGGDDSDEHAQAQWLSGSPLAASPRDEAEDGEALAEGESSAEPGTDWLLCPPLAATPSSWGGSAVLLGGAAMVHADDLPDLPEPLPGGCAFQPGVSSSSGLKAPSAPLSLVLFAPTSRETHLPMSTDGMEVVPHSAEQHLLELEALVSHAISEEGRCQVDQTAMDLCRSIAAASPSRKLVSSTVAGAAMLDTNRWRLQRLRHRLAALLHRLQHSRAASLRSDLSRLHASYPAHFQILVDIEHRSYDETPTKMRVGADGASIAKVMQSASDWALLVKVDDGDWCEYILLRGTRWTTLQVVDRTTGECIREHLEQQAESLYDCIGSRKLHIVCTDDAPSGSRAEAGIRLEPPPSREPPPKVSTMHLKCNVHKAAEVVKNPTELLRDVVS